jgi:hypothetical protein
VPHDDSVELANDLFVEELFSVGLVAAGANPESDILITKRREDDDPAPVKEKPPGLVRRLINIVNPKISDVADAAEVALAFDGFVTEIEKARNIAEMMEARIHSDFTFQADDLFGNGRITRDERKAASSAIGAALDAFTTQLEDAAPDLFERDPFLDERPIEATAEESESPTLTNESQEKEAEVPDITLSDEARKELPDDATAYIAHLEAELAERPAVEPTVEKEAEVLKDAPPEFVAMLKERDDEIADIRKRAEKAEADAAIEREIRLAKAYVEKAESFSNIAKAEDLGPVLQSIATAVDDDTVEKLEGWLKAAHNLIDDGAFFKEFGAGGVPAEGSAQAIVEKKGAEYRAAHPDLELSQAQAEVAVMKADPALAQRVDAEERARVARS